MAAVPQRIEEFSSGRVRQVQLVVPFEIVPRTRYREAVPGCSTNDLQQSALIHQRRVEIGNLQNEAESIRDVSDSEAGVEGGAATFKTHNYTTEIALQLDDGCALGRPKSFAIRLWKEETLTRSRMS